ncbi:hypothetical protein, partial [Bacillus cereus]
LLDTEIIFLMLPNFFQNVLYKGYRLIPTGSFLDNVKGETDYVIICNSKIILRMVLFYFIILAKKTPSIRNSQQVWVSGSSSKHAILFDLANT